MISLVMMALLKLFLVCRREAIQRLERVQNERVWQRYAARRSELQSQGWLEVYLFHGTSKKSLASITKSGFVTSLSHYGGLLFFARAFQTSTWYSQKMYGPTIPCEGADSCSSSSSSSSSSGSVVEEEENGTDSASKLFPRKPAFISEGSAMLLCRVLVPQGSIPSGSIDNIDTEVICTIESNELAYPEYIIHYQGN